MDATDEQLHQSSDKARLRIVIIGDVGAGKSTTAGHLMFKLGGISDCDLEKLRTEAEELGDESPLFSFLEKKNERTCGATTPCGTRKFFTPRFHYTIIDAPDHRGASHADVALLMVPATPIANGKGKIQGQIREQARLCLLLGIEQMIVGINKMDHPIVNYSEERYTQIKGEVDKMLTKIGYKTKRIPFIPISAYHGDNLDDRSENMAWWNGFQVRIKKKNISGITLLDALDNVVQPPRRISDKPMRMPVSDPPSRKSVLIIGAGWYGCHIARTLGDSHNVTLVDKNDDIVMGISGSFGVRVHAGPHYPRSETTRHFCRNGMSQFVREYDDILISTRRNIYALGRRDANLHPPKVGVDTFRGVCEEHSFVQEIDINSESDFTFANTLAAFDVHEPYSLVGTGLREHFREVLGSCVKIIPNCLVSRVHRTGPKLCVEMTVAGAPTTQEYDFVINASSYQSLVSNIELPHNMSVGYQVCLALRYKTTQHDIAPPIIWMDGLFPCLMPMLSSHPRSGNVREWCLINAKYTLPMWSRDLEESRRGLNDIFNDEITMAVLRAFNEREICRFLPDFTERFTFQNITGTVLAKMKSGTEFRSAFVFGVADEGGGLTQIVVFPGKITDVHHVARDVAALICGNDLSRLKSGCGTHLVFPDDGSFHAALKEVTSDLAKDLIDSRSTCNVDGWSEARHIGGIIKEFSGI